MNDMQSLLASQGGLTHLLEKRRTGYCTGQAFERQLQFPEYFVAKLDVEEKLHGHSGCVNRLAWNQEGTMLASGSDDRQVMLWQYPCQSRPPIRVATLHEANIFGVAFLPCSDNRKIVTGAMDKSVQLHHLDHAPLRSTGAAASSGESTPSNASTTVFNCHQGRVKAVDVEPGNPYLFWSASEDGTIRQFDTRCGDQGGFESRNVLVTVQQKTRRLDLLSLKINKARSNQLAVAANDQFVRLYDRRMLNLGTVESSGTDARPMLKMTPPHMCLINPRKSLKANPTYVDFGVRGDKLLASYHAENAYAFDINSSAEGAAMIKYQNPVGQSPQPFLTRPGSMPEARPIDIFARRSTSTELPELAEAAKTEGNRAFFDTDDNAAVWHYTKAIHLAPDSAMLYNMRAAALLKREWLGDAYAALGDCERAIQLQPSLIKAHCRRILSLNALGQLQAAKEAVDTFQAQFPNSVENIARVRESVEKELKLRRARIEAQMNQRSAVRERRQALMRGGISQEMREGVEENEGEGMDTPASDSISGMNEEEMARSQEGWLREATPGQDCDASCEAGRIAGEVHRTRQRYLGHCNVQTDIKEASFMGGDDELVAAGSDDGRVFIYDAQTGYPIRVLEADEDVVNCVQPHPTLPVLATSGIESAVRLWHPVPRDDSARLRSIMALVSSNQERLKSQCTLFRSVTPGILAALTQNPELLSMIMSLDRNRHGDSQLDPEAELGSNIQCRQS